MTDEELIVAYELARARLRKHGRYALGPTTIGEDEPPITVDGEYVILHYASGDPQTVFTYAIDKSLTLGQFIDGFNTTMTMLYGPPQADPYKSTATTGAHTHQYAPYQKTHNALTVGYQGGGGAIAAPLGELTFMGKPLNELTETEQQMLTSLEKACAGSMSLREKARRFFR